MNDICHHCDLDREICSCTRALVYLTKSARLIPTRPDHYLRDQYDPRDDKEGFRVA